MERYNVLFNKKLNPTYSSADMEQRLRNIKFPSNVIDRIKKGQSIVVKRDLSLSQAKKLKQQLHGKGLNSKIGLTLNPECLSAGLVENDITRERNTLGQPLIIDHQLVKPQLVSLPQTYSVSDAHSNREYSVKSESMYWNALVLIVVSCIVALTLELYIVRALSGHFSLGLMATVVGIALLITGVTTLPKIFQPLSCVRITHSDSDVTTFLIEQERLFFGKQHYGVFKENGHCIAEITCKSSTATLYDSAGNERYRWNKKSKLSNSEEETMRNMQDSIIEDTIIDELLDYYDNIRKFASFFLPRPKIHNVEWKLGDATGIANSSGQLAAAYFDTPYSAYRLTKVNEEDAALLTVFCMTIARR